MELVVAPDEGAAAREAARWVARRLRAAVRARGVAHAAFSGGSTPALMFHELAGLSLPWPSVHVYQVDERAVPDDSADRNAALLGALPVPFEQLHLMGVTARDRRLAARRYAAVLPSVLDVVHLGVGDDGHTASWPPGDEAVVAPSAGPVAWVTGFRGVDRMTLTAPVVNAAGARLVLVTGATKAAVVGRWMVGDPRVPVQTVRRVGTTVVLDEAAASALPPP